MENHSLLERTIQTSPIKDSNFHPISPLHLHRGIWVVLDFVLLSKLVRSTYALYAVSVRRCRILPTTSFRLSYYSDNPNYPSETVIRIKVKVT